MTSRIRETMANPARGFVLKAGLLLAGCRHYTPTWVSMKRAAQGGQKALFLVYLDRTDLSLALSSLGMVWAHRVTASALALSFSFV